MQLPFQLPAQPGGQHLPCRVQGDGITGSCCFRLHGEGHDRLGTAAGAVFQRKAPARAAADRPADLQASARTAQETAAVLLPVGRAWQAAAMVRDRQLPGVLCPAQTQNDLSARGRSPQRINSARNVVASWSTRAVAWCAATVVILNVLNWLYRH